MRTRRASSRPTLPIRAGFALLCAGLALGCAYGKRQRDIDRQPVRDTGVGAQIIYPGQSVAMPGSPAQSSQSGTSPDPSAREATLTPGQTPVTFIGGASEDEKRSVRIDEEPVYYKYLLLPFAVVAAPFAAVAEAVRGEEQPGPELPQPEQTHPAPPPAPPPVDYESQRLEAMEHELDERGGGSPPPAPPAKGTAIADELAALQRRPVEPSSPPPPSPLASAPAPPPGGPLTGSGEGSPAAADGIVDRDGDGRIDQWIFRKDGEIVRNLFDDDGDGRPERTLHYDPQTHRISQVEEDLDGDGRVDSWTDYREGRIVRRRADTDGDGNVDSWSYFRDDEIERHESDTTGDGFRDRVRFYEHGQLVREEQDNDGDGRAEVTLYYDSRAQVVRRDEDTDGDGAVDTISYYENGHLARRELISPQASAPGQP